MPIKGAVRAAHVLNSGDVGHRLRVEVWASNITGPGVPQVSRLTRIVRPLVTLGLEQGALNGLRTGRPSLSLKLAAATGQQPLRSVTVSLPGGLTLSRSAAKSIRVLGTRKGFSYRLSLAAHKLRVICRSSTSGLRVTIPSPVLRGSPDLAARAASRQARTVSLQLLVTESYGGKGRFTLKIPVR